MKTIGLLLILVVCLAQNGCMTTQTIDAARGHPHKDRDGQTVLSSPPQPARYWLIPLTVTADTVLTLLCLPLIILPRPVC